MMRFFPSTSDAQLLASARTERDAFARFYERYERPVLGYFLRRTRDPSSLRI
jgi:hypothetical protein